MKRINYLIILLISIFVFSGVGARSVEKLCEYNNVGNPTSQGAVTIKIYDDGSADAVVTMSRNEKTNNNENIQNWSSMKGTYNSKKTCPTHVSIYDNGTFSNMKVWAFYSESEAIASATENKATILTGTKSGKDASEEEKNLAITKINEFANSCNGIASMNFNPNSCKDSSKITERYEKCNDDAKGKLNVVSSNVKNINDYVSKGYISASDELYTKAMKMCDSAEKNVKEYQEALNFISCKEYQQDMKEAPLEKCKTTANDVEDNKYVKKYYTESGDAPKIDTNGEDFFKICDPATNPQLVASFKLVGIFVTIAKIIVPVILIIMGSLDMSKAVVSKDNDAIQKSLIVFLKRSIAGVLIFLAPNIILGVFHMIDGMDNFDSAYQTCVDCILGSSECPDVSFIEGK